MPYHLGGIGGRGDKNDENSRMTALREIREETGADIPKNTRLTKFAMGRFCD